MSGVFYLCFVVGVISQLQTMYEYSVQLINIIDADTLAVDLDLGFKIHIKHSLRLARVNAPELLSIEGMKARAFVEQLLAKATVMKIRSSRSEKYGRWLGEFLFQTKEKPGLWLNLSDLLLESGNAQPYKH